MLHFLVILGCCIQTIHSQTVWQVIEAIGATDQNGIKVNRLNYITINDSIRLENGYLLVSNHQRELAKFDGDGWVLPKNYEQTPLEGSSVNLKSLFQTKRFGKPYGATLAGGPYCIEVIFPTNEYTRRIDWPTNQPICLLWKLNCSLDSMEYKVHIENVWSEVLLDTAIRGNQFKIDLAALEQEDPVDIFILRVSDNENQRHISEDVQVVLGDNLAQKPNPCESQSAVSSLQLAIYFEWFDHTNAAYTFYKLASEQSEQPIFSELFQEFQERNTKD